MHGTATHRQDRAAIGRRLRETRLRLGLTQVQAAELANLLQTHVSAAENGSFSLERLSLFARVYGVSLDFLVRPHEAPAPVEVASTL